jgi:hypothetical protein
VAWHPLSLAQKVESGSNTDTNTYTSASTTCTSGALVIVCFVHGRTGAVPSDASSLTASGLTNVTKQLAIGFDTVAAVRTKVEVWTGLGTGSAATIAMNFPETQNGARWWIGEVTNADTVRGTNGVTAHNFGSADASNTLVINFFGSSTVACADAGHRVVAVVGHDSQTALTPKTGWTEHYDLANTTPSMGLFVEAKVDTQDNAPTATFDGGALRDWGLIAIAIAALESDETLIPAGNAAGTGTAHTPKRTAIHEESVPAEGTGTANDGTPSVSARPGALLGLGTGLAPDSVGITLQGAHASGSGDAFSAGIGGSATSDAIEAPGAGQAFFESLENAVSVELTATVPIAGDGQAYAPTIEVDESEQGTVITTGNLVLVSV